MYDLLIVGAGLYGAVVANEASKIGLKCLVLDRRSHIGGNCYTENLNGIEVHKYGAHIFRTSKREIWEYLNEFDEFNNFINTPIANYKGELFNLPFNMNTFYKMWGVYSPSEVMHIIESQRLKIKNNPKNLEEKAISLVGKDIYLKLIKGYTEKQWGRPCSDLPASIINRIPIRFTFNNNYFNDIYQGIPKHGYTYIIKKMLESSDVLLDVDFNKDKRKFMNMAKKVLYTGPIDEFFDFCYGTLEYRTLYFRTETLNIDNLQGVAVMNFTDIETPYTRRIEHKHFVFGQQKNTVVSYEYPIEWKKGMEPYYPINDEKNHNIYNKYLNMISNFDNFYVGGRLGEYRYYDMQDTIFSALKLCKQSNIFN